MQFYSNDDDDDVPLIGMIIKQIIMNVLSE